MYEDRRQYIEINNLIAKRVLGWEKKIQPNLDIYGWYNKEGKLVETPYSFRPSELIQSVWPIVEGIMKDGYDIQIHGVPLAVNKLFDCIISKDGREWRATAQPSAPLAICLAVLQMTGVKEV